MQRTSGDFTVLDFGCGLAHLKEFLDCKYKNYTYSGVDIVEGFVDASKAKYPNCKISLIDAFENVTLKYDYIIASGVFNLLYTNDKNKHKEDVFNIIRHLFSKTKKALLIDFMHDKVDFIQDNNYHQNIPELYDFISEKISKRFIIDQSYMPYEFSCAIYKDDCILRPDNIFRAI
jgi:cyclopropane fatty-acyl-phospholipid synthase-like methyltransferase